MNKILGLTMAAIILAGSASVYAGGSCCMTGKAKDQAGTDATSGCSGMMSKLNLTKEQRASANALMDECRKATSTSECRQIMNKGMEKILTPSQLSQWKADCQKAAKTCSAKGTGSKS